MGRLMNSIGPESARLLADVLTKFNDLLNVPDSEPFEELSPPPGKVVGWRRFEGPHPESRHGGLTRVHACSCGRAYSVHAEAILHSLFANCESKEVAEKRVGYWVSTRRWYAPWTWRRGHWRVKVFVDPLEALAEADLD